VFTPTDASALNISAPSAAPTSSAKVTSVSLQSVLPSPRWITADLGPVKMQYPENWQVTMPKKHGQSVTIAPQAGIRAVGFGYGVILNGVAPPKGERMSIDDVTRQIVKDMEQNETLQQEGNAQSITVGGVAGRSVSLHSIAPFPGENGQPQRERDW